MCGYARVMPTICWSSLRGLIFVLKTGSEGCSNVKILVPGGWGMCYSKLKSAMVIGKNTTCTSFINHIITYQLVSWVARVSQQPSSTILVSSEQHKNQNSLVAMYSHVKCNTHTRFNLTYQFLPCEHDNAHWIWFGLIHFMNLHWLHIVDSFMWTGHFHDGHFLY